MISLRVAPAQPSLSWAEFQATHPNFSIALDGYVGDGPKFDARLVQANLNHHENVDRLATRATCGQVLIALRQGLFRTFRRGGQPTANVYVNDCDEDVCTSWYLLKHHAVCEQVVNPLLNRLVAMEDALDATAGAYPFPADLPVLRELAWVFEPYRRFRAAGSLDAREERAYRSVIDDVEGRIARHITGGGETIDLDLRYERVGGGTGWAMVKEIGAQARTGMFAEGISAFVSAREMRGDRWAYVLGRLSPFIPFDLPALYDALNAAEGTDGWGGSNTVGGSPRGVGSALSPTEITKIIERSVVAKAAG